MKNTTTKITLEIPAKGDLVGGLSRAEEVSGVFLFTTG